MSGHHALKGVDEAAVRAQKASEVEVWNKFEGQEKPNFFEEIIIAKDGGFSEVGELWYNARWATALITLVFLVSNLYYTFYVDLLVIERPVPNASEAKPTCIIAFVLDYVLDELGLLGKFGIPERIGGDKIVAGIELTLTMGRILLTLWHSLRAMFGKTERVRWFSAEAVWWSLIPDLYTYSAMRLLHYVSPQVLVADFSIVSKSETAWKSVFVFHRLACFVIGFDAFLLKCRECREFLAGDLTLGDLGALLIFLKQVLGIVQLGMFVRDRLFIFIFAGEDGIMQMGEASKKKVWNAMLVREIFRTFSLDKAMVVLLSFDDSDFQKLVLNDTNKLGGKAAKIAPETTSDEDDTDEDSDAP
uniref:Uncharacterized protein n=1 Tax=Alexandrium catenella TaxID=2925 RepID=A0A7S1LNE2_ALECA|mmetsp:Transcript_11696/g.31943  ORF Transcript_11696/g.31943 Transcript_11696/m.31943 type:complete len:360 (+) Transcript_11696:62-1141(+)